MVNVAFLYQGNLVQREVCNAFRKCANVRCIVLQTAEVVDACSAEKTCAVLQKHRVGILVTINDWGMDTEGILEYFLLKNDIAHIDWCVDDPLYYRKMRGYYYSPLANRLTLVSDRGYVQPLRRLGYRVFFVPLATDASLFYPSAGVLPERDACFVGNSYRELIDRFVMECGDYLESIQDILQQLLQRYRRNLRINLDQEVQKLLQSGARRPFPVSFEKLVFIVKHFTGYLYRKSTVVSLADRYEDFVVFGDALWVHDLPKSKVSANVGYYKNLCTTYQQTRVNLDINRVVIRDGFTQRIFDCLSAGCFIISSAKPCVFEYFHTRGPRQQLAVYETPQQLEALIDYYLANETLRREIAQRGCAHVRTHHTYMHRIADILKLCNNEFGTRFFPQR